MYIHIFRLLIFLIMLGVIMQSSETFKIKKPLKLRPPKLPKSRYRSRWHPPRRHKQRYKPPPIIHHYRPHKPRYHPRHSTYFDDNDISNNYEDHEPYEIEIELQKGIGKNYDRNFDRSVSFNSEDYSEEDEDYDTKVFRAGKKKVRVKVIKGPRPKLRIKISRSDNINEIKNFNETEIINSVLKLNEGNAVRSKFEGPTQTDWYPINPPETYWKNGQGV